MIDLSVKIGETVWKNPVTTASGTFSPKDTIELYDFSELGAVTTKGVSIDPWQGNNTPRIAETSSGMINAVGLENPGVKSYLEKDIPYLVQKLSDSGCKIITNVAGHSEDEYLRAVDKLDKCEDIHMLEINISCPNIKDGGMSFGTDPGLVYKLTKKIKDLTKKPIMVKLTPNVTDICEIALSAEEAGADALSLINTLAGMRIDTKTAKPILANTSGGLSGPAVKPVAIKMVYDVSNAVNIPIIGMGGIMNGEDAVEFFMAGASAVSVGTAALIDPQAPLRILNELTEYMAEHNYNKIEDIPKV